MSDTVAVTDPPEDNEGLLGWVKRQILNAFRVLRERPGMEGRIQALLVKYAEQQIAVLEAGTTVRDFFLAVGQNIEARGQGVTDEEIFAAIQGNADRGIALLDGLGGEVGPALVCPEAGPVVAPDLSEISAAMDQLERLVDDNPTDPPDVATNIVIINETLGTVRRVVAEVGG